MENRFTAGKRVALLGISVNLLLLVIKLIVGHISQSQAMIADGFNSMGDVFASLVTLMGSIYAAKPKDRDHAWGHGKAEYLASMIIGFFMIGTAIYTIISSVGTLLAGGDIRFSWWLVGVAVATIVLKGSMYAYTIHRSRKYKSVLMKANALDHRNDVIVTGGTLAAIILSTLGYGWADGAAGILISAWIVYTGFTIIRDSSGVLMDENADDDFLNDTRDAVLSVSGIDHVDSINAMPVGAKFLVVVKVSVNRNMSVVESHEIATRIKDMLIERNEFVEDVLVHINPDGPHRIQ